MNFSRFKSDPFYGKIKKAIGKYRLLDPGDRVVVAVSGGPDSVCLLSVLRALMKELKLTLHVAHLDHMFRGQESAAEARFVRELAEKLGVPATIEQFDVPSYCRERGLSPQTGAREVRYAFLERVASTSGASKIALGHTASDQAETLLMRLIRGAGVSGLSGIPLKREKIIRPLIEITRDEVLEFLREQDLSFVTDSSNLKPVYTRNRVRLELMPALKKFNPRVEEALSSAAVVLQDENEAMEAALAGILPAVVLREASTVRIRRDAFNALLPALQRRVLRAVMETVPGAGADLSFIQTEEILGFMAEAQTGRSMDLAGRLSLEREYDSFIFRTGLPPKTFLVALTVPGSTPLPEFSLEVETSVLEPAEKTQETEEKKEGNYLWQAAFDYDKIAPPLVIRNRREGDRFRPAGMVGSKKLQDFFTDEKVPRAKRDAVPLLLTGEDILWVIGMRTDGRFLPGPGTKKVLVVRILPSGERSKK